MVSRDSTILQVLFVVVVVVNYDKVWSSGQDQVICLYVKVPEEFVCAFLQDRCWVVHLPFIRLVKFEFLLHLPVDQLSHPVVSIIIIIALLFASFPHQR